MYIFAIMAETVKILGKMKTYTLKQTQNKHGEVFDQAIVEPVLITKQKKPSHVIISAEIYEKLIAKLEELEDFNLGKKAEKALTKSLMVGSEEFTASLEKITHG